MSESDRDVRLIVALVEAALDRVEHPGKKDLIFKQAFVILDERRRRSRSGLMEIPPPPLKKP